MLKQITEWFKSQFHPSSSETMNLKSDTGAKPPMGMTETLKVRIEGGTGLPDELCAIFASLIKAIGVDVRIVRYSLSYLP